MGRTAGVPNKITLEVKEKLQLLIDDLKTSLGVNELEMIRNFRTKYLDSKNKLAMDYEGAMIPPSLTQKLTNQIIQNCGVYVE